MGEGRKEGRRESKGQKRKIKERTKHVTGVGATSEKIIVENDEDVEKKYIVEKDERKRRGKRGRGQGGEVGKGRKKGAR